MDERNMAELIDRMSEGVYTVNLDRVITSWNPGAEQITGYTAAEVIGRSCSDGILRHVNDRGTQLCLHGCPLKAVMRDGRSREAAIYLHHKDGHRVPVTVSGQALRDDDGEINGSIELFSARAATRFARPPTEDEQRDSSRDPVTDIGNRRYGDMNLKLSVEASDLEISSLGVLFIDVDYFKSVNDTFGHRVGDAVLRMVAQTLANGLSSRDFPIRWGGEEFLALLPGTNEQVLATTAERIRMLIEHSYLQDGDNRVRVTASIGAAMHSPGESAEDLIDRADKLMYQSKSRGRNLVTLDSGTLERVGHAPIDEVEIRCVGIDLGARPIA